MLLNYKNMQNKVKKFTSDITLLTCNYNNQNMTINMIKSFLKNNINIPIIIMDNSDINPILYDLKPMTIIDNTNYKLSKKFDNISKNHAASIDYAFKHIIKTKYVLLCDNDILFKNTITELFSLYNQYDVIGEINADWCPPNRVLPYCCIIDLEKLKENNINYFDETRCCIQLPDYINCKAYIDNEYYQVKTNLIYDTGASFYDDIRFTWNIKNIQLSDYIVHFKNGCQIDSRNSNTTTFNIKYKYKTYDEFIKENINLCQI